MTPAGSGPSRTATWRCPECGREARDGHPLHRPGCSMPRPVLHDPARDPRHAVAALLRALDEGRSLMLTPAGLIVTDPKLDQPVQMVLDDRDVSDLRGFAERAP